MSGTGTAFKLRGYVALGGELRAGRTTPRAYLDETLKLIAERDAGIGAFVVVNKEAAIQAAVAATARWRAGKPLSPIDGMPVAIKDIIETADMPTGQGSPLFAGQESHRDSASVHALREAGAIIIGKTTTTEFAASYPVPHHQEPARSGAHAGRLVERLRRGGRRRHDPGRARHPGRRLDPAAIELLRRGRLQAERRRNQPQRLARSFQPELPGRDRRHAGRRLGGAARHRRPRRRRSGLRRPCRRRRSEPPRQAGAARHSADRRLGRDHARAPARLSPERASSSPRPASNCAPAPTIPTSRRPSRRWPTPCR